MMRGRVIGLVGIAAAFLVAACADTPIVGRRQQSDQSWVIAQGGVGAGMAVVFLGNPYPVDEAVLHERVVAEMGKAVAWSSGASFQAADPGQDVGGRIRIVWAFNGGPGGEPQCRGDGGGGGPAAGGAVRINATLCDGDALIADITGRVGKTTGIDDPAFASLVRQVTLEMLWIEPERHGGDRAFEL